jgi:hypothetical protein
MIPLLSILIKLLCLLFLHFDRFFVYSNSLYIPLLTHTHSVLPACHLITIALILTTL